MNCEPRRGVNGGPGGGEGGSSLSFFPHSTPFVPVLRLRDYHCIMYQLKVDVDKLNAVKVVVS